MASSSDPRDLEHKLRILFFGTTRENSHGVPVVMNNLTDYLRSHGHDVGFVINLFDDHFVELHTDGSFRRYPNRSALLRAEQPVLSSYDIFHFHSWHFAPGFVPFHTEVQDTLSLDQFLGSFPETKVMFTDHSNPTEDADTILRVNGIDFLQLSSVEKRAFLDQTRLKDYDLRISNGTWKQGWTATAMLGREWMYRHADVVTHISAHQKGFNRDILELDFSDPSKHHIIYNAIDMIDLASAHLTPNIQRLGEQHSFSSVPRILYVGRAVEEKGFYDLLHAVDLFCSLNPDRPLDLLVAGDIPPHSSDLTRQYPNLGKQLKFLGRIKDREDLAALYQSSQVVVQPTHGECFNQVIGEALAMGTPVIATETSGPFEVYGSKGIVYNVPVRNPVKLAETLEDVLTHPAEALRLAQQGKAYVAATLSPRCIGGMYTDIYHGRASAPLSPPNSLTATPDYQTMLAAFRQGDLATAKRALQSLRSLARHADDVSRITFFTEW
ncbi:glycosyltransferase family 4 protein [Candidatus Woesearchaeota archaeon]|nr:glycosyltransferase family 4 protein [Candidatus Woesearchaeota archaeon]